MSDLERWQEANDRYLEAALAWLRPRLESLAPAAPAPHGPSSPAPAPPAPAARWTFFRPSSAAPTPAPADAPAREPETPLDARIARAHAAMEEASQPAEGPPPALLLLAKRLGLSTFEREILLLAAALELDPHAARLCALAQGDPARPYPTFSLAFSLFDEPVWEALSPDRPLRRWRLLEINQPGAQPLTTSALRADERVVNYLKGLNELDDRLAPLLAPLPAGEPLLAPSQEKVATTLLARLTQAVEAGRTPLVQLLGADGESKQQVARQVAAALGLHLYRLPAALLPRDGAEIELLARLWQRESLLLPIALYLEAGDGAEGGDGPAAPLQRFLSRAQGLIFLDAPTPVRATGPASLVFEVARPTPAEQREAWLGAVGEEAGELAGSLAAQFDLALPTLTSLAADAGAAAEPEERAQALWSACRAATRPRLENLAQRLEPKAGWEDLVLPAPELGLLRQVAEQVGRRSRVYEDWGFRRRMSRGLGISALFAGDSGTGKTMAAEVIARELDLDLYRIDLSAVVSKYIGETEKNLRRLFDTAEEGGAILFFDEADALFGKRSEVKDSHDRYANIEINYLLQRMESYSGLAVLATNQRSALDTAFLRRIRFILNFPFPSPAQRREIWRRAFPPETPRDELDWERLARFNLTGGNIHSIAVNAAFLAAAAGTAVTMPLVLAATKNEIKKLEKPVNEADFVWLEEAVA
ncbi:MAG TPA: ATP-binding protein [Thermoanaerobaculia bacterium]|nr:ATP-binding protein [Thermoanaerobaculia bacterium]